jgi:hypothetical protein
MSTHPGKYALASSRHTPGQPHRPHYRRCTPRRHCTGSRNRPGAANPSMKGGRVKKASAKGGRSHPPGPPCLAQLPPYELAWLEAQQTEVQLLPAHGGASPRFEHSQVDYWRKKHSSKQLCSVLNTRKAKMPGPSVKRCVSRVCVTQRVRA